MKNRPPCALATTRTVVAAFALGLLTGILPAGGQDRDKGEEDVDLLRFLNGDSLHGSFVGLGNGATVDWKRSDARETIVLETAKLRRIALNGGRAKKALTHTSFLLLEGGDRIPGRIVSIDEKDVTIETELAGTATVPRKFLRQAAPNPHGGTVHYIGPFVDGEWTIIGDEEEEEAEEKEEEAPAEEKKDGAEPAPEEEGPWVFSGGAYYSNSQSPIAFDAKTPDKARIRFTLAWRNRLNAAIAFHATLKQPEKPDPEEGDDGKAPPNRRKILLRDGTNSSGFATTYGHSYVLTIFSNYAQLYRCDFDKDGNPDMDRLSTSSANLRLDESGQADFELRCDRESGNITLFANGSYVSQWEDTRGYAGTGSHLAFACASNTSHLRVSDVVVSSWNGMIDSAQSMEVDDRDIVLMTNGTDRFSGKVLSLQNGKLEVKGTYATMQVPLADIQEIRFARDEIVELPEQSRDAVRLILQPVGRLTISPIEATRNRLKGRHPALGEIDIDLRYAGLLEFSFSDSVLDVWDDDF